MLLKQHQVSQVDTWNSNNLRDPYNFVNIGLKLHHSKSYRT